MRMEIGEEETGHLAWIHSNKFTTSEIFHRKFVHPKTYRMACHILRNIYLERGLLDVTKAESSTFQDSMYFLTTKALQCLDAQGRILVRNTKFPVRVNPHERDHDLKVQFIRVAFEANPGLGRVFWVSDFEMRSGITPAVKKAFLGGELDKAEWRSSWEGNQERSRRTPDGYFEADLDGKRYGFTFEFENVQNPEAKIEKMLGYLEESFPKALRLVVSENPKNAARMIRLLRARIGEQDRHRWFVSDYDKAVALSFKKMWHQITYPVGE